MRETHCHKRQVQDIITTEPPFHAVLRLAPSAAAILQNAQLVIFVIAQVVIYSIETKIH